jgi:hypothetical protein
VSASSFSFAIEKEVLLMLSRRLALACFVGLTLFHGFTQAQGAAIEHIDLRVEGMT